MEGVKVNYGETYSYHSPSSSDRVSNREILSPYYSNGDSPIPGSVGFIEHWVSKMDTLAGVAIKYGVEVGDIKMINGLTTDLQMFALKSLKIPTPGRHPPSPCFYDSSSDTSREEMSNHHSNLMDSWECMRRVGGSPSPSPPLSRIQLVSPAMTTLQCYYGLDQGRGGGGRRDALSPTQHLPPHRRSRSLSNGFHHEGSTVGGGGCDGDAFSATTTTELVRRRQRGDIAEVASSTSAKPGRRGGGTGMVSESADTSATGDVLLPLVEPLSAERGVRKSSSMSSLQGGAGDVSPSTRPAQRCGLKPPDPRPAGDIPRLPRPTTTGRRRHKAALD